MIILIFKIFVTGKKGDLGLELKKIVFIINILFHNNYIFHRSTMGMSLPRS
jgi:hypothetical protein